MIVVEWLLISCLGVGSGFDVSNGSYLAMESGNLNPKYSYRGWEEIEKPSVSVLSILSIGPCHFDQNRGM